MREFAALVRHFIQRRAAHRIADMIVSLFIFFILICCGCGVIGSVLIWMLHGSTGGQ